MDTLLQDLSYAVRGLLNRPAFTLVAVFTIAIGIGANSAIFSLVDAMLLHPLVYENPDKLIVISEIQQGDREPSLVAPANFNDWKEQSKSFDQMAAYRTGSVNLTGEGKPERVPGVYVSASLFTILDIRPLDGRVFTAEENRDGSNRLVIISEGLRQRRFGTTQSPVGKNLMVNGEPLQIVGVMPSEFQFPLRGEKSELWRPIVFSDAELKERGRRNIQVIGRLKGSVSLEQARSELDTIARELQRAYPDTNTGWKTRLITLQDQVTAPAKQGSLMLLGAVAFVLLISCANAANLLLARATTRQKELAIRVAMGARRSRLVRQLLTESLVLSLVSGAVGLLLAWWSVKVLISGIPDWVTNTMPRIREDKLDWRVLLLTLGISLLTGIIFGLAPALFASKPNLNETLKENIKGSSGSLRRRRFSSFLIVSEVALALILLIGAGLMIKSFLSLQKVNPGFNSENVLTLVIAVPSNKYPNKERIESFYAQVLERVKGLPGVQAVGAINNLPMALSGTGTDFTFEGRQFGPGNTSYGAGYRIVSGDYFRALTIPLARGRSFTEQDNADAPPVVIINETLAKRYWPHEDPVGQRILIGRDQVPGRDPVLRQIVGVASNVHHFGPQTPVIPEIYVPRSQTGWSDMTLVVKTSSDPMGIFDGVYQEIKSVDPDQPVYKVRTMEQVIFESAFPQRFGMTLLIVFAAIALLLAAVGIYAVISYSVAQRTHEIGIRMALGAQRWDVLKLVLRHGMTLVLIGVGIGLVTALAMMRVIASLLYETSPTDPLILAGSALILVGVAAIACIIPAKRAIEVNPLVALRYE